MGADRHHKRTGRKPPLLLFNELSGRVYVATAYRERPGSDDTHVIIVATTRHDVTDAFERIVEQRESWEREHG